MANPIALFIGCTIILVVVVGLLESFDVFDSLRPRWPGIRRRVHGFFQKVFGFLVTRFKAARESINLPTLDGKWLRARASFLFDKSFRRKAIRAIALLVGGCLFAFCVLFGLFEFYYRSQGPDPTSHRYLYRWHREAGFALNANYHYEGKYKDISKQHDLNTNTNAYGFRSREMRLKKKGYRILMLGDSFTFGTGVDDNQTTSWILEDLLQATPGYEHAEVLNAGTNGSSNVSQVNYFKTDGVTFNPDLVVLNLYTGNDFDQNLDASEGVVQCFRYGFLQAYTRPGEYIARVGWNTQPGEDAADWIYIKPSGFQRIDEYFHEKSWFYRNVSDRMLDLGFVQDVLKGWGQIKFEAGKQKIVNVHQTKTLEAGRKYTQGLIARFQEYLRERGMQFVVHVIPLKNEVRVSRVGAFRQDSRENTEAFLAFLKAQGIPYVYDAPVFEENEPWVDLTYNALFGHYTTEENEVSSAILYRFITREVLGVEQGDQGRALMEVISVNLPLTRPDSFFTMNDQLPNFGEFDDYALVSQKDVKSLTYEIPGSCTYGGGPVEFDRDVFESNLLSPNAPRVYIYPGQDWGTARLDFTIALARPMHLKAIVADVPAIYANYSTTKMVLYDEDTDRPLAGALAPYKSWVLLARNIGPVQNLKISLFRYAGANTFSFRGFQLFYN